MLAIEIAMDRTKTSHCTTACPSCVRLPPLSAGAVPLLAATWDPDVVGPGSADDAVVLAKTLDGPIIPGAALDVASSCAA